MMPGMSVANESQVPHRPPQFGDDVEVRLRGFIIKDDVDGGRLVTVQLEDASGSGTVTVPAEEVAILRDVPRDQPRAFRAHQHDGLEPRLPTE
jgi:hypothetical protein